MPSIDLTPNEFAWLHAKITADLIVYMQHDARGGLFPEEKKKMKKLEQLEAKFSRRSPPSKERGHG